MTENIPTAYALDDEVPVLIIGGSMIGLATAVFLAQHGIRPLVIEKHDGTAIHPRAGHFHLRTLELLRGAGLEERVRLESEKHFFPNGGINGVETLAGGETARFIADLNAGVDAYSPTQRLFIAQQALEPILRERAEELGARLHYACEAHVVSQDDDGVTVRVHDRRTGTDRSVRARYVVAADGARSPVRAQLGIDMHGHGLLSRSATVYFRADCRRFLTDGSGLGVIYVNNEHLRGFFRFDRSGTAGFLGVNTLGDPRTPGALDVTGDLSDERAHELVAAAIGDPSVDIEILGVMPWDARADLADRFQDERIFLVGDAAHVVPPNGGFGGNTGVQDAHNIAWKLAAVLHGQASDALLRTYEVERRPVAALTIGQAYSRYRHRTTPELMVDDVVDLVDDLALEIGYTYRSAAVAADLDPVDEAVVIHPDHAAGLPGTRAPHVVLTRGGERLSTLDLYGRSFVLLTGPDGTGWAHAAAVAGATTGIDIRVHVIGDELADEAGAFLTAHALAPAGAVLVRPDGFIAWRSAAGPDAAALGAAVDRVLGHAPAAREPIAVG